LEPMETPNLAFLVPQSLERSQFCMFIVTSPS
jgi:hypothetical protein